MSFRLADAIFWVAVVCCTIAELAIIRSAIVSPVRDSAAPASSGRRATEIAWAVLPGAALAAVLFYTWKAMR
jgi:heme/copper-type cytochrome/quinol oxidase subunit 2